MSMMSDKIEFYKHNLNDDDIEECLEVLRSLFITTGNVVKKFEDSFAKYIGSPYAVGVGSCTDALFLALKAIGVKEGDEVITTPMSFIATANAIEYCGAIPVFVDVEKDTGNIDVDKIENAITEKTKAVIVVHMYGQMCDMKKISKIGKAHNLTIIEDAAHCVEGERDGVKVGQLADFACFSFYATKNITSGEGGLISCHDKKYYEWLIRARLHGMSKNAADRYSKLYEHYDMEILGYKMNMTNIQASLLIHQLERIESLLESKESIATLYNEGFVDNKYISTPKVLTNSKHARHIYTIWVNKRYRDKYLKQFQDEGIGVAINFRAIHLMSYYQDKYGYSKGSFPNAEQIGDSTITIPLYPKLTEVEVRRIVKVVNRIVIK